MKIKIVKIGFLMICIGAFLFLLLPFLETTPPPEPSAFKNQPQVTTDNPLTAIAKRLRTLLDGKERARHSLTGFSQPHFPRPADEFLAAVAATEKTSGSAHTSSPAQPPIDIPPSQEPFDFGEAALQTDQGEWVLIRQTTPQSGQPGMHEVNVHDNPYDRYVKQERTKRALPQHPKPEIPNSKWARLVRPIKQFFGLDTPTPVGPSAVAVSHTNPHAQSLASAKDFKQTGPKSPSMDSNRLPWPDITPQQWTHMTPQERQREQERRSVARFADLLSGERAAQEAAEIAADAKYPHPQTKQEEQAKEQYREQIRQQNKQIIKNGILQVMQQNAQDKEWVDELSYVMNCRNNSLPASACDAAHPDGPTPPAPADQISQEQGKNMNLFYERTGYELPKNLPLTVVLGPTTPQTISQMAQTSQEKTKQAAEIYQFLYEKQECASNTCYWVANSKQQDPQLTDAVSMTSAQLKPDPKNTYPGYKQDFVQYKLDQLPENATDAQKEQTRQTAQKQFEENAVHFVPYTPQQLREVQAQTLAAANPANQNGQAKDLTIFYMTDPAQAHQFAQDINSVIFGYGQISLINANTAPEAAEQIINSTAQNVNDAKGVVSSLVTRPTASAAIEQAINQQIREQNQSGAGWEGIFNTMKNFNHPPHKGGQKK